MEKVYQATSCLADYSKEKNRVYLSFEGQINMDEYKKMSKTLIDFLENNVANSVILDFRDFTGLLVGLNEWLLELFQPIARLGVKREAIIIATEDPNYPAAIDASTKTKFTELKVYKDYHDAELWLDEVD